jgi:REP element-mobilizing transposase RayT
MPLRRIPFVAGSYYHLFNRGVNRGRIFFRKKDYSTLTKLLEVKSKRARMKIPAYCLMPNHFHLLIQPQLDHNVSQFMNGLFGAYVQRVNHDQGRRGPLFEGRFKALLVDREEYLCHLVRYIHLNPVDAGLVTTPEAWPYSNYLDVIERRPGRLVDHVFYREHFPPPDSYRAFMTLAAQPEGLNAYLFD